MLLGEIRSRNISMVPILQDVSQLKTLYPQDKWEIFSSNCSAVVYLGSGPTAYTTHKWMSDMLGETTIDTRSETISQGRGGSSSLQNSKAGMKLMTPEQVREMPNRDCIIMIEGMKPVYDRKNRPFAEEFWKEAEAAAGQNGYTHPVRVIHDREKDIYKTVRCQEKILMIDKDEEDFYRNAEKTDNSIHVFDVDGEDFLYLNWDEEKQPTLEELQELVQNSKKKDVTDIEEPDDVKDKEDPGIMEKDRDSDSRKSWDLTGSITECIRKYADRLTAGELENLFQAMQDGLSERQIKRIMILPDEQAMDRYRKIFLYSNRTKKKASV